MQTELLKEKILSELNKEAKTFDDFRELCEGDMLSLREAVNSLMDKLEIVADKYGRLTLPKNNGLIKGRLSVKRQGFGFVIPDEGEDVFIEKSNMRGALNGETVLVKVTKAFGAAHKEGRVIRIMEQPYTVVGEVRTGRSGAVLVPADPTVPNIKLARKGRAGALPGQMAVCLLTRRAMKGVMPEGKITEILGDACEKGVDILSIARSFGLREEFGEEVEAAAGSFGSEVKEADLAGRKLFFDKRIFTIDGADAKDLDDAVSIEKLRDGSFILGVHIADVSHYVTEGSVLDNCAVKRGTSVYMVDRVVPMLPRALSNGLCSLNEGVTRLTLSCIMKVDHFGNVLSHNIYKSAIKTVHRMTYDDVNAMINGEEDKIKAYRDIYKDVLAMNELAHILREKRFTGGSIDFDIPEAKITLDENNIPCDISLRTRGDAERLIEEFMLLCNNTIAQEYCENGLPFVYRIHEKPDADKLKELAAFYHSFGLKAPMGGEIPSFMLQDILMQVSGTKDEAIINRVTLRSLKKAKYSPVNEGHYGLASEAYCHFTSPIRRYPDLQIHRIIKECIDGRMDKERLSHYKRILPAVSSSSSERERNAIDAERRVNAVKMAEYMERHIGEEYWATISGVTPSCLFAELDNTVEGVIPYSSLKDDFYEYDEKRYMAVGYATGKKLRLGDRVKVRVADAVKDDARVEFELISRKGKKHFAKNK